jgi:hypothetical protein
MHPSELVGKRVLLLLLDPKESARQALFSGIARAADPELDVLNVVSSSSVQIAPPLVQRDGFAPTVLPRLVGPDKYLELASSLAQEVAWCVPLLTSEWPSGAQEVPGFIAGLACHADGRVLLMQVR